MVHAEDAGSWEELPIKRVARIAYGLGQPPPLSPDGVPILRATNIYRGSITRQGMIYARLEDLPLDRAPLLQEGEILVVRSGAYTGDSAIITAEWAGSAPGYDLRVTPIGVDPRYLSYCLLGQQIQDQVQLAKMRAAQPHLNAEDLGDCRVAVPPLSEQRAIAAFLDREIARIDNFVDRRQRLRMLVSERFATARFRAVTKGLAAGPTRDSGVEWIGRVPAHWQVRRLKQVAQLESGHTPSRQHPEYWENCTVPWVSLTDVAKFRDDALDCLSDTNEYVSELGLAHSSARLLPAGTVIVSRTASVGFSCILGRDMATTQDFANWICGPSLQPEYLLQVFRSMRQEFSRLTMGSTHSTIYMPDIARFTIPLPPVEEQDIIVAYLHRLSSGARDAMAGIARQTELLQERRRSLITAAVTGQIDISQVAA
jgi:type I restriction enzyme S subunit